MMVQERLSDSRDSRFLLAFRRCAQASSDAVHCVHVGEFITSERAVTLLSHLPLS